jgi:hypothetical protein
LGTKRQEGSKESPVCLKLLYTLFDLSSKGFKATMQMGTEDESLFQTTLFPDILQNELLSFDSRTSKDLSNYSLLYVLGRCILGLSEKCSLSPAFVAETNLENVCLAMIQHQISSYLWHQVQTRLTPGLLEDIGGRIRSQQSDAEINEALTKHLCQDQRLREEEELLD